MGRCKFALTLAAAAALLTAFAMHAPARAAEKGKGGDRPVDGDVDPKSDYDLIKAMFEQSKDPKTKVWKLANYLRGTPAQVKGTMEKEVLELAEKTGVAERKADLASTKLEKQQSFLLDVLRESKTYKDLAAQIPPAEAEVEKSRKAADVQERMAVSSKLNKLKAQLAKMEKSASEAPSVADLIKEKKAAVAHIAELRKKLKKASEWRQQLVDATITTAQLQEPLQPGETAGLLQDAVVLKVLDDGSIVVRFFLMRPAPLISSGEGMVVTKVAGTPINIRIAKPDFRAPRVGDPLPANKTYRVTKSSPTQDARLTVERYPTDVEYLLDQISTKLDVDALIQTAKDAAAKRSLD